MKNRRAIKKSVVKVDFRSVHSGIRNLTTIDHTSDFVKLKETIQNHILSRPILTFFAETWLNLKQKVQLWK